MYSDMGKQLLLDRAVFYLIENYVLVKMKMVYHVNTNNILDKQNDYSITKTYKT